MRIITNEILAVEGLRKFDGGYAHVMLYNKHLPPSSPTAAKNALAAITFINLGKLQFPNLAFQTL